MQGDAQRTRLVDVARRAGVSVPTASRAMNGTGRVSADTRDRVRRAAEELSYRPDPSARSLRLGRSPLVGLVIESYRPDERMRPETLFWQVVLHAAAHECAGRGYGLVVVPPGSEGLLTSLPLAGVAVISVFGDSAALDTALSLGVPVLGNDQVGRRPPLTVDVDREAMVRDALDHLRYSGVAQPGLITFDKDVTYARISAEVHERWCRDRGVDVRIAHVDLARAGALGEATAALARDGCDGILTEIPDGLEVIRALATAGLRVPDDVQVLAIQEPDQRCFAAGLSTVSRSPDRIARDGVCALIDAIEGRLALPAVVLTGVDVVPRSTTRPTRPDA